MATVLEEFLYIMDSIFKQINILASTADDVGRKKLQLALRDAQFALEDPYDTLMRIAGMVRQNLPPPCR